MRSFSASSFAVFLSATFKFPPPIRTALSAPVSRLIMRDSISIGDKDPSGPQGNRQSAHNRFPHEGQPAAERAQNARALAVHAHLRTDPEIASRCALLRPA